MSVCLVTVGIGDWERWTFPLIESVRKHEPEVPIVAVDNGADPSYPHSNQYQTARIDERTSYAAAMNYGIRVAPESDYYIVINNDVRCLGPFSGLVHRQPDDVLAGNHLNAKFGWMWIDSWHWSIPRRVWDEVGEFDENFKVAGFEDADYCFRAEEKGFLVLQSYHPFRHLAGRIRWTLDDYGTQRHMNLEYLMDKHELREVGWHVW